MYIDKFAFHARRVVTSRRATNLSKHIFPTTSIVNFESVKSSESISEAVLMGPIMVEMLTAEVGWSL